MRNRGSSRLSPPHVAAAGRFSWTLEIDEQIDDFRPAARATCTVDRPGVVNAELEVSDDHGHAVRMTASGEGANRPPTASFESISLAAAYQQFWLYGSIHDPDEGLLSAYGGNYCVSAASSGACGKAWFSMCDCLGGLEADVIRTVPSGTCKIVFSVMGSWGLTGTSSVCFDVSLARPTPEQCR